MDIKNLFRNPIIFGITIAVFVVIFNISIATLAEGSLRKGYSVFMSNGIFVYLVPLAVGIQMGLFKHHKNLSAERGLCSSDKAGIFGSATSSISMIFCCLHHITDFLPTIGFLFATVTFLTAYKDIFISVGLLVNLAAIIMTIRKIRKIKL